MSKLILANLNRNLRLVNSLCLRSLSFDHQGKWMWKSRALKFKNKQNILIRNFFAIVQFIELWPPKTMFVCRAVCWKKVSVLRSNQLTKFHRYLTISFQTHQHPPGSTLRNQLVRPSPRPVRLRLNRPKLNWVTNKMHQPNLHQKPANQRNRRNEISISHGGGWAYRRL